MTEIIRITRVKAASGAENTWLYACTGPDGKSHDSTSEPGFVQRLRQAYGPDVQIVKAWEDPFIAAISETDAKLRALEQEAKRLRAERTRLMFNAHRAGVSLQTIGGAAGMTREAVRQFIEPLYQAG